MRHNTAARLAFALLVSLSLTGCINYEQETFLNEDMSGRIEIHMFANPKPMTEAIIKKVNEDAKFSLNLDESLSKATYKMKFDVKEEDLLKEFNREAIKSKSFRKAEKDGISHFYLTVEFDDIRKLFADKDVVSVTEDRNGLITYTQFFVPLREDKDKKEGKTAETPQEFFKGFGFRYILHMPYDIVSANADRVEKNTAIWELPLEKVANNKDFYMTASVKGRNKFLRWLDRFKKNLTIRKGETHGK